jgi:type IV secretion system protein VirB6
MTGKLGAAGKALAAAAKMGGEGKQNTGGSVSKA